MTSASTRLADAGDHAAAVRVWQTANTARGRAPGPERVERVRAKLADPAATVIVAGADRCVRGMLLAEPGRERDGLGPPVPELCHISMVFVHPEAQGRGIGRLLLEHAVRLCHPRLQVWTGVFNDRARRLYRSAGFTPSGRRAFLATGDLIEHLVRAADPR